MSFNLFSHLIFRQQIYIKMYNATKTSKIKNIEFSFLIYMYKIFFETIL